MLATDPGGRKTERAWGEPVIWLRLIRWVASKLACRRIEGEDGSLYLLRFKVIGWMPGDARRWPISVYLHRFSRPDNDEAPHNHPWKWAFSVVLSGGYTEERLSGAALAPRVVRALSLNWLGGGVFHRVAELHGETWTLFVVGPKSGSWGFWTPDRGVIPWRQRLEERGIKPAY